MARVVFLSCAIVFLLITSTIPGHTSSGSSTADLKPQTLKSAAITGDYSLVLVDAGSREELDEADEFIQAQGGKVAFVFPPHAILGTISPDVSAKIIGQHKIRSIYHSTIGPGTTGYTDRETLSAIGLFNEMISGSLASRITNQAKKATGPGTDLPPLIDDSLPHQKADQSDMIRNLRSMGAHSSVAKFQSNIQPQFFSNSDSMDGKVAVAVFFMESNGGVDPNLYSWSEEDKNYAYQQVVQGLNWWVEQSSAFNLGRPLQFIIVPFYPDNPVCQQPYEPILHPASDANLWLDRIMSNVGSNSGTIYSRIAAFDRQIRDQNNANWAYSIFISYNPSPVRTSFTDGRASWAYIGGPHANVLFRSFGWDLARIVTHETGHIFYACDEYYQPGYQTCSCTCAPEIRPAAQNHNCQDASCTFNSVPCMMRLNEFGLCPYTVAQIGWTGTVQPPAPTAPESLVATAASPTQVDLIWQDTSKGTLGAASGFMIERRGGSSAEYSQIGTISAASASFSDTTVLPNTAYAYHVRAFNNTGESDFSNETTVITPVTASALSVSTDSLPDAVVGVPYDRTLSVNGGKPDYRWTIESGSLPSGFSLSQNGDISGTPTTAGTSNFAVRVTDGDNSSATKPLSLVVKPAAPLSLTTTSLPKASVGTTYSQNLGAKGGQTPYNWAVQSGNLPDGLILNQTTGAISGIPERAGSSSFVVTVTDQTATSVSATLSILVNPGINELTFDTESLPDGVVGQAYSRSLKASGGNSPYLWEIKRGALPQGLALSQAGAIEGKPQVSGEVEFDIQVSDQSGQSAVRTLSIDVDPSPELTIVSPTAPPQAALGVPYSVDFSATAGQQPYKWLKKNKAKFGTLPDGLSLSKEGRLSGTPTREGTFDFTIMVKDAGGKRATRPLTIEVGPPPPPLAVKTTSLPSALRDLPYNSLLEATGGLTPYTWAIESGILPDGLTMTSAGVISGTPTTIGSTTFTVRVQDSIGTTSLQTLFITVTQPPPPLVILTTHLPETTADQGYSQTLSAAGGVPPYTWTIASGSLGQGLNLSAAGVISGIAANAGTSVFVVRVTDSAQQTVQRTLAIEIKPADKLAPFGNIETPDSRATLNRNATVTGWALDNVGIVKVEILVDGTKMGEAIYGLLRPDIALVWGSFPKANLSGFSFTFDTTVLPNGSHTLVARALDQAGNATLIGSRTVQTQNQVLVITTGDIPKGKKGEFYSTQLNAANGVQPYTWTLNSGALPQGLSLNVSGRISGTPQVSGNFSVGVRVSDAAGASATSVYTLVVQPDFIPLTILVSGDLDPGVKGEPYSFHLLFTGGRPPYLWGDGTGTLPPGLSLNYETGIISGTPTQVGNFTFTVKLNDSTPSTITSQPLRIRIDPGPLTILSAGALTAATVGEIYSQQIQFSGGVGPYTWSLQSGALPAGLSLNTSTGAITGTPSEIGTSTFTVKLTDSTSASVTSTSLSITVMPGLLTILTNGELTPGTIGKIYTYTLLGTGGVLPYTWSIESGALPSGVTLDGATGVISGTPAEVGTYTFTVKLTDSTTATTTSGPLTINVGAPD